MRWKRKPKAPQPQGHIVRLAVDSRGERYTEHTFATETDPWWGATILTPSTVQRLSDQGLLPLNEIFLYRARVLPHGMRVLPHGALGWAINRSTYATAPAGVAWFVPDNRHYAACWMLDVELEKVSP